jgi:hypothetical protein
MKVLWILNNERVSGPAMTPTARNSLGDNISGHRAYCGHRKGYMARKRNNTSVAFDAIGEDIAKVLDIKRRLIETGIRSGNPEYARAILDDVRNFVRAVREELEAQLHDRSLEDMTPNQAQQAIYGCRIFEESLRAHYPDLYH